MGKRKIDFENYSKLDKFIEEQRRIGKFTKDPHLDNFETSDQIIMKDLINTKGISEEFVKKIRDRLIEQREENKQKINYKS